MATRSGNLYLIGMMGAGKSSLGAALARRLGRRFADSDLLIAERAGQTIAEIFAEAGQGHFRELESDIVAELAQCSGLVVALGGGAYLYPDNRELINRSGQTIYLQVRPETVWERAGTQSGRPLLAGSTLEEKRAQIRQILQQRHPVYAAADLTVPNDGDLETCLETIITALGKRGWL